MKMQVPNLTKNSSLERISAFKDPNSDVLGLQAKISAYKEKILNDKTLDSELNLYIEPLTKGRFDCEDTFGEDVLELAFYIRKYFLNVEGRETPQVLYLTGQAGIGKSLFCKYLQREILSVLTDNQDPDERKWFPIYIELSSPTTLQEEAISDTLVKELFLTADEVLLLQTTEGSRNRQLPQLLFIFDGYNYIEPHNDHWMVDDNDVYDSFSVSNKLRTLWKEAKVIITYRDENLHDDKRRELLCTPTNEISVELPSVRRPFLHRKIEPFTNEQITCYLKKFYISRNPHAFEGSEDNSSLLSLQNDMLESESPSWKVVKMFEKLIDIFNLRECARIPFMLRTITHAMPCMSSKILGQGDYAAPIHSEQLSSRFLIELYVKNIIKSIIERNLVVPTLSPHGEETKKAIKLKENQDAETNQMAEKLIKQAQIIALRLSGYSLKTAKMSENIMKNDDMLSEFHLLIKANDQDYQPKFCSPLLLEFFVAKSIEDEINEMATTKSSEKLNVANKFLFNQKLMTSKSYYPVLLFLQDALKEGRLTTSQFMNIILLSLENEFNSQNAIEMAQDYSEPIGRSSFAVAATNAITILNATGYNFSHQDLSSICVPGANLSYGIFEGTNFTNADLRGVDFVNAWLKDANLTRANLEAIELGGVPSLQFKNNLIISIAYSSNGKYFALDTQEKAVIFENTDAKKLLWKEFRSLPGNFPHKINSPFSADGKQIVTVVKRNLIIWDVLSGQLLKKINISKEPNKCVFSFSNAEQIELFSNERSISGSKTQKYNTSLDKWVSFPLRDGHILQNCDINPHWGNMIILSDYRKAVTIYNSTVGRLIQKQRQETIFGKFSSDGRQIASRIERGSIHISDFVRGHRIKSFHSQKNNSELALLNGWVNFDGKHVFSTVGTTLEVQDVIDASVYASIPVQHCYLYNGPTYCLSSGGKRIAMLDERNVAWFTNISDFIDLPVQTHLSIRGNNRRGLNLKGTIIDASAGLSEGNIRALKPKGDYFEFNEDEIKKIFQTDLSQKVMEINLSYKNLTRFSFGMISRDSAWKMLQKLNLSRNNIGDKYGELMVSNQSWPNLKELTLYESHIGAKTATAIANNLTWRNLKSLVLSFNKIGNIGAEAIGKSKIWEQLEMLGLRTNEIDDEGASFIGDNKSWENLITLDISFNNISKKNTLIHFCSNSTWKNLKSLMFENNPTQLLESDAFDMINSIVSDAMEVLKLPQVNFYKDFLQCLKTSEPSSVTEISSKKQGNNDINAGLVGSNTTWTSLRKIDLSNNYIKDRGGSKIGSNIIWNNLEELDLSYNLLGIGSGVAIGGNSTWNNLRTLNLDGNKVGSEGACMIGKNLLWNNLQLLDLTSNNIDAEGALGLSKNTTWVNLETLNLGLNSIGPKGAKALSEDTTWSSLITLDLHENDICDRGAVALGKNITWSNLRAFILYNNKIADKGAAELVKNTTWTQLRILNLEKNSIGDQGATGLGENTVWTQLQVLNLGNNRIRGIGAGALGKNTAWPNLQTLNLSDNKVGLQGVAVLSKNMTWINLKTVNLGCNSIGPQGAEELGKNTVWNSLQTLTLEYNQIGAKGAFELCKSTAWPNLITLDLSENDIGAEGAGELSKNSIWSNLQTLNLYNNCAGDKGASELSKNVTWTKLRVLDLGYNSISAEDALELSKNTTWTNLEILRSLGNDMGSEGNQYLRQNSWWSKLHEIN